MEREILAIPHGISDIADVVLTAPHEPQVLLPSLVAPHFGQSSPCMVKMADRCGAESVPLLFKGYFDG